MTKPDIIVDIGKEDPSLNEIINAMRIKTSDKGAGAIVAFIGFVKGLVNGRRVEKLVYTAYDKYVKEIIYDLTGKVVEKYSNVRMAYVYHKIGELSPGDTTIYILVSAVDRDTGFSAAREILEAIKKSAPIFKLEVREDGEYWVVGDKRINRSELRRKFS